MISISSSDSLQFQIKQKQNITIDKIGGDGDSQKLSTKKLNQLRIFGVEIEPMSISLSDVKAHALFEFNRPSGVTESIHYILYFFPLNLFHFISKELIISNLDIDLPKLTGKFVISIK